MVLIHVSLSPNTQMDDVLLALKLIVRPWRWRKPRIKNYELRIKNLEEEFKKYHNLQYACSFNSGRSALMAILYAFGIGEGDEIIIQAFTCNAVPNPIIWMGAKPIYVDVDDTLNIDPEDLEKKITSKSKAVIIQHTFGVPAQIDKILAIAKNHKLFIVEDCAHSLGAGYGKKVVGTFGDAAFFSFGRDKVISSVYGGMAITNNPDVAKRLEAFWQKCKSPSYFWILQQLMHPVIFAFSLPFYNFFNIGKIIIKGCQLLNVLSMAVTAKEKQGGKPSYFPKRMPETLAALALHQFQKLDRFNDHRRQISEFYRKNIVLNLHIPIYGALGTIDWNKTVFLRWNALSPKRDEILRKAKKQGIYLGDWYTNVIAPNGTDLKKMQYITGSCPKAEAIAKQIFNLPTHINTSIKDAKRIVEFLNTHA